jgi:transcriptional regulator with GAF, ATPase, and Fis domain
VSRDPQTFITRIISEGGWPVSRRIPVTRLRVTDGSAPSYVVELETPVVRVGSATAGNDVVLDDDAVSRYHLSITWDEVGPRLKDLESTNGTYVDGVRTIEAYLRAGSVLRIGRSELTLEDGGRDVDEQLYEGDRFGPLLGRSAVMRRLFALLARVAPTDMKVLIEGETGTGKELCARAIHEHSRRREGPFVTVDCAAMASGVLQSELFGHERGAYTGATERRIGQVEAASGGTLFLDEIGELPLELQPNLLRVLEANEVRRLGSQRATPIDVRVVAATNRDLAREVNRGTFREDLYYRLSIVHVEVPPLRDRREDLPLLVEHLARKALGVGPGESHDALRRFSPAALSALSGYRWPGNVRELRNVVERTLTLDDLAVRHEDPGPARPIVEEHDAEPRSAPGLGFAVDVEKPMIELRGELIERFERAYLTALMARHDGKIAPASRASGLDRAYLRRLLKKYS